MSHWLVMTPNSQQWSTEKGKLSYLGTERVKGINHYKFMYTNYPHVSTPQLILR